MYFSTVILSIGLIIGCFSALGSSHGPPGGRENFRNAITECKNSTGTNEDEIEDIMRHIIPNTKNGQCMVACIEKKIGIMGEDNKISMEKAKAKFSHLKRHREDIYNKIIENIQECQASETAEDDECVAGLKFAECMFPKERPFGPPFWNFINECKNKSGVNQDEFQNFIKRNLPETKNEQCMLACIEKKTGLRAEDNKIVVEKLPAHLNFLSRRNKEQYDKILKIHKDCAAEETTEADECVAAFKYAQCVNPKLEPTE